MVAIVLDVEGVLGQAVAALADALGMKVTFAASLDPEARDDPARPALLEALPTADVVSLHCPLTKETDRLVNDRFLEKMKRGALLINTARGGLVDELALARALREGRIGGAALDVLSQEPPAPDHPLLAADIPNLLITPHNAWISDDSRQRLLDGVAENVRGFLAGELINCVNGVSISN